LASGSTICAFSDLPVEFNIGFALKA